MTESSGLARFNKASKREARKLLETCCGASRWVSVMLALRPFGSAGELLERSSAVWQSLDREDFVEALSHSPELDSARAEPASDDVSTTLREKSEEYRDRFGYPFVCESGSASEVLAQLEERLSNSPEKELAIAAAEQQKLTRQRLETLIS